MEDALFSRDIVIRQVVMEQRRCDPPLAAYYPPTGVHAQVN